MKHLSYPSDRLTIADLRAQLRPIGADSHMTDQDVRDLARGGDIYLALLQQVVQGLTVLSRPGVTFTPAQRAMIAALSNPLDNAPTME